MLKQEVLIIGAGSTGLAAALEIAKSGKAQVTVLEKDYIGAGQTGQCCGFVRTFYNAPEMIISASYSMRQIKLICRRNAELKYQKMGLLVIDNIKNKEQISRNVELLKSLGVKASYLEGSEINKINPYLSTKDACAGFDEEAGYINPHLVAGYLKNECLKNGVKIYEQTEVLSIRKQGGKFRISTNNGSFSTLKLFNATAGYANSINRMLGITLPVKTIRINNAFYRLPLGHQNNLVAIADFEHCFYAIPHDDFIDVSTMMLDLNKAVNPAKDAIVFDYRTIEDNRRIMSARIKGAEKSASLGGFGSHIDVTADYYPILSKIDEIPNYYCATGFSGTGFKHFPMIAKLMKEIILEEKYSSRKLIKFFRYDRFASMSGRQSVRDSYFIKEE